MRALLAFFLTLLPVLASAQGVATLVADTVFIAGGSSTLVAEGNVEVLYDDTRLTASRVTYKQDTDAMTIEGPIAIVTGDNDTIILANAAQIDPTLQNGLLRGARLVLDQQLQLAASQMNRVEGRYTQLYQVAATSCHVCQNKPPLWSIRASRVIHDEAERQLYFENAQFRIYDVPVLWVPWMRLPDPTLERATGLLIPKLRTTTELGIGLKLPYFITLGKHRDLTLTPYF
ncbi:MAG: LPS-assembly protein LptD, partial [Paracoccaceae bacterium]|nr:LPS-assembly protein LptD [Paracoccaceae bacterium]